MAEYRASPQVGPGHNLSTSTHSTRFINRRNLLLHQATGGGVNGGGAVNRGPIGIDEPQVAAAAGSTCLRRSAEPAVRQQLSVILHHNQQEQDVATTSEPARPSRINRSSKAHQLRLDSAF